MNGIAEGYGHCGERLFAIATQALVVAAAPIGSLQFRGLRGPG